MSPAVQLAGGLANWSLSQLVPAKFWASFQSRRRSRIHQGTGHTQALFACDLFPDVLHARTHYCTHHASMIEVMPEGHMTSSRGHMTFKVRYGMTSMRAVPITSFKLTVVTVAPIAVATFLHACAYWLKAARKSARAFSLVRKSTGTFEGGNRETYQKRINTMGLNPRINYRLIPNHKYQIHPRTTSSWSPLYTIYEHRLNHYVVRTRCSCRGTSMHYVVRVLEHTS